MARSSRISYIPFDQTDFEAYRPFVSDRLTVGTTDFTGLDQEKSKRLVDSFVQNLLPNAPGEKGHYFYWLEDVKLGRRVGSLWFQVQDAGSRKTAFLHYLELDPEIRGRGYVYFVKYKRELDELIASKGATEVTANIQGDNRAPLALAMRAGWGVALTTIRRTIDGS